MGKDFVVRIRENTERAETFMKVFGRLEVNVQSPVPFWANLPGYDEPQLVYLLDLKLITADERRRVIDYVTDKFSIPREVVEADLDTHGMPIRDEDCVLIVHNPQRWLT